MTIYVAAIKGRGIATFYAENGAAAMVRVRDPLFRDDLMVLPIDGLRHSPDAARRAAGDRIPPRPIA